MQDKAHSISHLNMCYDQKPVREPPGLFLAGGRDNLWAQICTEPPRMQSTQRPRSLCLGSQHSQSYWPSQGTLLCSAGHYDQESAILGSYKKPVINQPWHFGKALTFTRAEICRLRNTCPPYPAGLLEEQMRIWIYHNQLQGFLYFLLGGILRERDGDDNR